jgi:RNA polymerase sigma factor (TIGR02999 family)
LKNPPAPPAITELLLRAATGEASACEALYAAVYADLNRIARHRLYESGLISVLDSPALVNEAYMRLAGHEGELATNRRVFFAYASKVMRNILLDQIKGAATDKRGSGQADLTLYTGVAGVTFRNDQLDALAQALQRLQRIDERACNLVELRYFGGLSMDECAEHLNISSATAARDWEKARAFLQAELA